MKQKHQYPEHEKLKKVEDASRIISEFLEFLEGKNLGISSFQAESLLAEFFGIDIQRLEQEKEDMTARLSEG